MRNLTLFIFLFAMLASSAIFAQVTAIPDANFEQALIDLGIDTNTTPDGQVTTADIDTIEQLNVSGRNIADLTGIEGFASLKSLDCSSNRLSGVNLSANPGLNTLICSSNQLTNLDIADNVNITTLLCSSNELATLDLSQNDTLKILDCSNNQLATLDVSANLLLENLTCSANKLTSLNVSANDSLRVLTCSNNQLTHLDVSSNAKLERLTCASNQIQRLDVGANTALSAVNISFNLLKSLDLSNNAQLTSVNSAHNLLQYLSIRNGNNAELIDFDATDNPFLTCISVDNVSAIGVGWKKDNSASYGTNCAPVQTFIPDNNFEQALIDLGLDTGPLDDFVVTDSINSLTVLDVSGLAIADLTGIEDFVSLASLDCSNNSITSLDLTKNSALTNLNCSDNALANLNLKNDNNASLASMDARNNAPLTCIAVDNGFTPGGGWQKDAGASYSDNCNAGQTFVPDDNFEQVLIDLGLDAGPLDNYVPTANINAETSLDVSGKYISDLTGIEGFVALETLDCSANLLASLDISDNTALIDLRCFGNYLSELDVTANTALISLHCGGNLLEGLDVTQNVDLEELIFDSNKLSGIDLSNNDNLVTLNGNSNNLTAAGFDLSAAVNLERLFCSNNKFAALDISQNTALVSLDCNSNKLTALDVSANIDLKKIDCSQNFIATLDLTSNVDLDTLMASSNKLTSIDVDSNPLLRMLAADNNVLGAIDVTNNLELRYLNIANNNLSSLNLNSNSELLHLNASDNDLNALDVTSNTNLVYLACSENDLGDLDISQNPSLVSLFANGVSLSDLNTSANGVLQTLSISNNQIETLDLAANTALKSLVCDGNDLVELDLQPNAELSEVNCSGNEIETLDLSLHPKLVALNAASNRLTQLSVNNGNNDTLAVFNTINNPDLSCIEVDDPGNVGSEWQKDSFASYSDNCRYNETYVPDDNFESALAAITGEPDDNDGYISTASIAALTALDVSNSSISDLTGIQDFVALQTLNISNNSIDSVYLKKNSDLTDLNAAGNLLTEIDLNFNELLQTVDLSDNSLTELNLDSLTSLTRLFCSGNNITELDLSVHSALSELNCASNQLEFLRVNNGNNANLTVFDATANPNLTCIEIDDENTIGAGWLKDETASYSENCHYNETYVPDDAFEQALIEFGFDYSSSGPLDDYVPTSKIANITFLNMRDRDIEDLTGIADFSALTSLDCSSNLLTSLDISANANLSTLNCEANQLASLDVSQNPALTTLNSSNNLLPAIDISQNTALVRLDVASNQLTSLIVLPNIGLTEIRAENNLLITVEANNGYNDTLKIFDLRNNPSLTCILVDDIVAANGYSGWKKDAHSFYKLECNDDDNDGVPDANDLCPTTPAGVQVDLFGCEIFSLPAENFTILTTSESCRPGNNGKINITAAIIHPYVATLYGSVDTVDYEFFDKVEIRNVRADTYRMRIAVIGESSFEQWYTLRITQPEDLKVFSSGRLANGRVAYELSGGSVYSVEINGRSFTTTEEELTINLESGRNEIQIKAENDCQGVFKEVLYVSEDIRLFPNPFGESVQVLLATPVNDDVQVSIYSLSGKALKTARYQVNNGILTIDTSMLSEGLYIIDVKTGDFHSTFKAVKK